MTPALSLLGLESLQLHLLPGLQTLLHTQPHVRSDGGVPGRFRLQIEINTFNTIQNVQAGVKYGSCYLSFAKLSD